VRIFKNREQALQFVMKEITWGNAAGTCKDGALAKRFAEVGMQSVDFGSITYLDRAGNPGDNFYYDEVTGNSVNSWGIPNRGFKAYLPELPDTKRTVNRLGAKLWVSISAGDRFNPDEYGEMAYELEGEEAADVIEGNFSCPNMIVGGKPKPNVCYELEDFERGIKCMKVGAEKTPIAVKLAPITEPIILKGLVEACLKHDVNYIVIANTIGNCYLEKAPGVPAITMVRGGLAGRGLRPVVKGMAQMIKPMLKNSPTKLIMTAGVETGLDAYEFLALGAHGFQFNTVLSKSNLDPRVAQDIIMGDAGLQHEGLIDLLVERGLPD
jgi:dihydroorotate dehydrogenase